MEEDQEFKHVCKFCSKSFPCGRSLGVHMRSHVANVSSETEEKEKLAMKKLPSLNNINGGGAGGGGGGGDMGSEAGTNTNANTGYGLRENPKKTWRLADSKSEDTLLSDKFCKVCGKGFHSWKALFGHMKCHSEKERVSNSSLDDQDSWTNATQKLVVDSQSDNEATAPNRRRRSKRRTRYVTAAAATAGAASSVCEAEQEQEEVAMSLMMLSRDVGSWGGLNSVAESSDNNSAYFEAPSSVRTNLVSRIEGKLSIPSGTSELKKLAKGCDKKWELGNSVSSNLNSKGKSLERLADENPGNGFRMNITRVSIDEVIKNEKEKKSELDYQSALEDYEEKQGKNEVNGAELVSSKSDTNKYSSVNTKVCDSELKSNSLKNWVSKTSEAESNKKSHKRGKFECTTCNKIFHSYQALGGHRASHKKIKGCFASRNESSENSIETHLSPEPTTESKLAKNSDNNEYLVEHELSAGLDNEGDTVRESNKSKGHVCPICLKDFPSGQALGGHKRSHLAGGGSESRNCQTVVLQEEPVPEIRDLLDLNLPAATEEESSSHGESYRPWWVVGGNHKQEALVGLMSN